MHSTGSITHMLERWEDGSLDRFWGTTLSYLLTDDSNTTDASGYCFDPNTYEPLLVDQRGEPRDRNAGYPVPPAH